MTSPAAAGIPSSARCFATASGGRDALFVTNANRMPVRRAVASASTAPRTGSVPMYTTPSRSSSATSYSSASGRVVARRYGCTGGMFARGDTCVRSRLVSTTGEQANPRGLSLAPFRGLRPHVDSARLGQLLCPPYDVIDPAARDRLLAADHDNAVAVVLPEQSPAGYAGAAARLQG